MGSFLFYHPIEVRYGDLDAQGHVNNACYLTYLEQARIAYIHHIGLWSGSSFLDMGVILADLHITYRAPIYYGQPIRVGTRTLKLGNKSFTMEQCIEDTRNGQELAAATCVLVAYDYRAEKSIPIPTDWRQTITTFEHLHPSTT